MTGGPGTTSRVLLIASPFLCRPVLSLISCGHRRPPPPSRPLQVRRSVGAFSPGPQGLGIFLAGGVWLFPSAEGPRVALGRPLLRAPVSAPHYPSCWSLPSPLLYSSAFEREVGGRRRGPFGFGHLTLSGRFGKGTWWEGDLGRFGEGTGYSWGCLIPPVSCVFAGASGSKDSSAKVGCSHPAGFREQSGEDFLEVAEHGSQAGKRESRSSSPVPSLCPHQLRSCSSWALHGVYFCRGFLPKCLTPSPTLYT